MSQVEWERFRLIVLHDQTLQEQLRAAPDWPAFLALALRLAQERGCDIVAEDVESALREGRRAWLERWL